MKFNLPYKFISIKNNKRQSTIFISCLSLFLFFIITNLTLPSTLSAGNFWGEVTLSDEIKIGKQLETQVKDSLPLIDDPVITDYAKKLVDKLIKNIPAQPYKFSVNVIHRDSLNAFAAPAGFIFIFSGLIMNLNHESELAGVLCHEIAHVTQRHVAMRIEQGRIVSIAALLAAAAGIAAGVAAGGGGDLAGAAAIGASAAGSAKMLDYSRVDEDAADRFGMQYLIKAGYNPSGLAGSFEVLRSQNWSSSSKVPTYLMTHPNLDLRLSKIQSELQTLPKNITQRKNNDAEFHKIQILLWSKYGNITQAAMFLKSPNLPSRYKEMGQAILYHRQHNPKSAKTIFNKLLNQYSTDSLLLREAGIIEYTSGNLSNAAQLLSKAYKLYPSDTYALFYYSRSLNELGKKQEAENNYKKLLKLLPEDPDVHFYYAECLGGLKKISSGYLHLAYSALYSHKMSQAEAHLSKAKKAAHSQEEKDAIKAYEKTCKQLIEKQKKES